MAWIYCIENKINDKKYIGKSIKSTNRRWTQHKSELKNNIHKNKHLQRSWNKYGEDNFCFYIIGEYNKEQLSQEEIYWIETYKTFEPKFGYNLTQGGEGTLGKVCSKKTREKIGAKTKGNTVWRGRYHTPETIKKMSDTKKGKILSAEHRKKLSEVKKGKSSPRKGIKLSEETKSKVSKSKKGTKDSEKTRKIKSEAQKKRWEQYRKDKELKIAQTSTILDI